MRYRVAAHVSARDVGRTRQQAPACGSAGLGDQHAYRQPAVVQKSGGLQGSFAYLAIAPTRGVAAFFVMNEFSTGGFTAAAAATNGLIGQLAPR
jgi:hypothetical protein